VTVGAWKRRGWICCDDTANNTTIIRVGCWENLLNQAKHDISFDFAQFAFNDPHQVDYGCEFRNGEWRWRILGMVEGILLFVVYTLRNDDQTIRIITARLAERRDHDAYFAQ
jgi:uncharacterized DUF497 family protein